MDFKADFQFNLLYFIGMIVLTLLLKHFTKHIVATTVKEIYNVTTTFYILYYDQGRAESSSGAGAQM